MQTKFIIKTNANKKHTNSPIEFGYYDSQFGQIIIATTNQNICYLAFEDQKKTALNELKKLFPKSILSEQNNNIQKSALNFFEQTSTTTNSNKTKPIKIFLKGTKFQIQVWKTLLTIPHGQTSTYGKIAKQINNPNANRAVGTAIGKNPVSYLIPCHRVIKSTGETGQYHWGESRKTAILHWESVQQNPNQNQSILNKQ